METNVGLLRSESRGECLFPMQADLWRPIAGEARGVPGTGNSLACALLNRMRDLGRPESYAVS